MKKAVARLPYFDFIFSGLAKNDPVITDLFGRHDHWGYWDQPDRATLSSQEFLKAADRMSRVLFHDAAIRDGERVLDAGCGFGGTIALLNDDYNDMRLVGVNIDPQQLERARELVLAKASAGNTIGFRVGDACRMEVEPGSFDKVLAVECIFHFPSRRRFFQEAWKALAPGGRLTVSDFVAYGPTLPHLIARFIPLRHEVTRIYGEQHAPLTETLYRMLARLTGFRTLQVHDITPNTLPTFAVMDHYVGKYADFGQVAQKVNRLIEKMSRAGWYRYIVLTFEKPAG